MNTMGIRAAWNGLLGRETPIKPKEKEPLDETQIQIKQMRNEYRRLQEKQKLLEAKAELRELEEEIYGLNDHDEESEDAQMLKIIAPFLSQLTAQKSNPSTLSPPPLNNPSFSEPPVATITDEQIHTYLKSLPKNHIITAKALPKELLFRKIRQQMPLSEVEMENIYKILMTEY